MVIIDEGLVFRDALTNRTQTTALILHHAEATTATVQQIHQWHLANGWSGIGYHYYIRKDGNIYRGRPENKVGAHAGSNSGYNSISIAICFEGAFGRETMGDVQLTAGRRLIRDVQSRYGDRLTMLRHGQVTATDCPGALFPFAQLTDYSATDNMGYQPTIYNRVSEVPSWGRDTVEKLIARGLLRGDETGLDLEYYMLRTLVINDRAGLYD